MFSSKVFALVIFAIFIASITANIVDFHPCPISDCTIKEVHINSCNEYSEHTACQIRRRKPASMSFTFVPQFDADTLEATLGWLKSEDQELPLATLDRNACAYTTCPVQNGVEQTYTINVPIESKFPLNSYTIKWNLKSPTSGKQCCFTTDIKVVR